MTLQVYELVKIQDPAGGENDFVLIARHEFDEKVHVLFGEKSKVKRKTEEL